MSNAHSSTGLQNSYKYHINYIYSTINNKKLLLVLSIYFSPPVATVAVWSKMVILMLFISPLLPGRRPELGTIGLLNSVYLSVNQ